MIPERKTNRSTGFGPRIRPCLHGGRRPAVESQSASLRIEGSGVDSGRPGRAVEVRLESVRVSSTN